MGTQTVSRVASSARDGAISAAASPGVHNVIGTMGALDVREVSDRRRVAAGVDVDESVLTLPRQLLSSPSSSSSSSSFFTTNPESTSAAFQPYLPPSRPSRPSPEQHICERPAPDLAPHADCLPLFYTFYLAPSASGSTAGTPSLGPSVLSADSERTQSTMPGRTFDSLVGTRLHSSRSTDCFSSPSAARLSDTRVGTSQLRPGSQPGEESDRTASPSNFACWPGRHHQQHHHHPNGHVPQEADHHGAAARSRDTRRRHSRSRSSSHQKRQLPVGAVAQMTREEFEALPLAIQRKYFSTLERLRFARESGLIDGISRHYDDISDFKRRNRNASSEQHPAGGRLRRGSVLESHSSAVDSSPPSAGLSEATHEVNVPIGGSCRDRLIGVAGRPPANVILDAADEAVYKLNQQSSRRKLSAAVNILTPPLSPTRTSMDSHDGVGKSADHADGHGGPHVPQSFYDSFRWLEEEEDLDLRLFLDDYHANLREDTPATKLRPSFRRHMSINKLPFGRRSSVSSTRPRTRDIAVPTSPIHSPAGSVSHGLTHARRKSRALSLITPKHAAQPSVTAFDPAAAHYQDPEARLKLRVYLASPQKFDEAVEFGFPSADALSSAFPVSASDGTQFFSGPLQGQSGAHQPNMRSFLADGDDDDDDNVSLNSDQPSLADPDSPKTPEPFEHKPSTSGARHARLPSAGMHHGRDLGRLDGASGYAQAPASSREMTLRMTLTRPDLRAHEDEIYGWRQQQREQQHVYPYHSRRPTVLASQIAATEPGDAYPAAGPHNNDSLEKFAELDHWPEAAAEKGVMRRIWNRMRRA